MLNLLSFYLCLLLLISAPPPDQIIETQRENLIKSSRKNAKINHMNIQFCIMNTYIHDRRNKKSLKFRDLPF